MNHIPSMPVACCPSCHRPCTLSEFRNLGSSATTRTTDTGQELVERECECGGTVAMRADFLRELGALEREADREQRAELARQKLDTADRMVTRDRMGVATIAAALLAIIGWLLAHAGTP